MTGLYIHIPFCQSICPYCDFSTWKATTKQHSRWLKVICNEMKHRIPKNQPISTIFFGGGTPSLLELNVFEKLMEELHRHLDLTNVVEFTLEANPISLNREKLQCYAHHGVTKISLGVQSFSSPQLKKLGRLHTPQEAKKAVENCQDFDMLTSIDLIFGVPEQTLAQWKSDILEFLKLGIPHLSIYGLTFEPNTLFHQHLSKGLLQKIPDELYSNMYQTAVDLLEKNKIDRYEVSNFATQGKESLHNFNYWNHTPYYGLGPGAHSFDGIKRYFNSKKFADYEKYVALGCPLTENNHETLTDENLYQESLWLGLRTTKGIRLADLKKRFHKAPTRDCLEGWKAKGMLKEGPDDSLRLIDQGWVFLDTIAVDCFTQSSYI